MMITNDVCIVCLIFDAFDMVHNLRWFIRTWPYALIGTIVTFLAGKNNLAMNLETVAHSYSVLWWLMCGIFTLVVFTYAKQLCDERICPLDRPHLIDKHEVENTTTSSHGRVHFPTRWICQYGYFIPL